jgi:hypothetical protein
MKLSWQEVNGSMDDISNQFIQVRVLIKLQLNTFRCMAERRLVGFGGG